MVAGFANHPSRPRACRRSLDRRKPGRAPPDTNLEPQSKWAPKATLEYRARDAERDFAAGRVELGSTHYEACMVPSPYEDVNREDTAMNGPDAEFRARVAVVAEEVGNEAALDTLLGEVEEALRADIELAAGENPNDDLAAVESWAAVASFAVARFHAPASPWPRDLAGWGKTTARRLRSIADTLLTILRNAAQALAAASFSIAIGFPWGISIGLSW